MMTATVNVLPTKNVAAAAASLTGIGISGFSQAGAVYANWVEIVAITRLATLKLRWMSFGRSLACQKDWTNTATTAMTSVSVVKHPRALALSDATLA